MRKYQMTGTLVKAANNNVEKMTEIINGFKVSFGRPMTVRSHASICKRGLKDIYSTSFVVNTIVLSVTGNTASHTITGTVFRSIGGNSPYARALCEFSGDYNKASQWVQTAEYNKKEQEVEAKYSVYCNDSEADTFYVNAESLAIIDFSCLDKKIKKIVKGNKKAAKDFKNQIVNEVLSYGMVIDGNKAFLATDKSKTVYNIISWSPSNERSETALLTNIELPIAEDIINAISGGSIYSATRRKRKLSDLVKFSKRIGIFGAPATETCTFGNEKYGCMIYMKEIQGPSDYTEAENKRLVDRGIIIDRNTYDGSYMITAELIQDMFAAKGVKISYTQALMLAPQTRASILASKVFGEAKDKKNMKFRAETLISMVNPDKILRIAAGQDVTGLNKDDYDLIIIGNPDNIGVIMDKNGAKALKDISLKDLAKGNFMNYMLDIAKASKTNISGQMLQKFISINKEAALKAYLMLMENQFDGRLGEKLRGEVNVFNCSLAQFIIGHVASDCQMALEEIIKTEISQTESQTKKFNVEIEALYLRALFDDAYFLTKGKINGVLGCNPYTGRLEAYSYDVELAHKEQIEAIYADDNIVDKDEAIAKLLTGVAFKYPSPSADENAIFTFLTTKQVVNRIAHMEEITKKEKQVLINDFVNTSYGVIKMAPNNTIKHRLAGMDTDYDGVAVVFEKVLVDIIVNHYNDNDGITVKKGL